MVNVGIIGVGGIAEAHLRAYQRIPEKVRIKAICDIDEERAKNFSKGLKNIRIFKNPQDLLKEDDIQAVSICTPSFTHAELCKESLKKGKAVLCEKPIAGSLKEIDEIIKIQKEYGGIINSVFQWRYGKGLEKLQEFMHDGLTGRILLGQVEISWCRTMDYYRLAPWRRTWREAFGGALVTQAIHALDVFLLIMPKIENLFSYMDTLNHDIEVDDISVTSLRCSGGALGQIVSTVNNQIDLTQIKFIFEHVFVESNTKPYAPTTWPWHFKSKKLEIQSEIDKRTTGLKDEGAVNHEKQIEDFVESVSLDVTPKITLAEARKSIELITAIYKSVFTKKPVSLPIKPQDPFYQSFNPQI